MGRRQLTTASRMKFYIAALIVCGLVLSSQAKRGKGPMMLKRLIDQCLANNPLDPAFECIGNDKAVPIPWATCADMVVGGKPPKPDAGTPKPEKPCKDGAVGDAVGPNSVAWVCMGRGFIVAGPCRDLTVSGSCVENTGNRGPAIIPELTQCA